MSNGIPLYPYRVVITFQPNTGRDPLTRACADLPSSMAIYNENVGKQNVHNVEVLLTLHKSAPTRVNRSTNFPSYLNKR